MTSNFQGNETPLSVTGNKCTGIVTIIFMLDFCKYVINLDIYKLFIKFRVFNFLLLFII